jgi:hypothetical protein
MRLAAKKAVEDWTTAFFAFSPIWWQARHCAKTLSPAAAASRARTSEANTATISETINMILFWFPSYIALRPIAEAIVFTSEQNLRNRNIYPVYQPAPLPNNLLPPRWPKAWFPTKGR